MAFKNIFGENAHRNTSSPQTNSSGNWFWFEQPACIDGTGILVLFHLFSVCKCNCSRFNGNSFPVKVFTVYGKHPVNGFSLLRYSNKLDMSTCCKSVVPLLADILLSVGKLFIQLIKLDYFKKKFLCALCK